MTRQNSVRSVAGPPQPADQGQANTHGHGELRERLERLKGARQSAADRLAEIDSTIERVLLQREQRDRARERFESLERDVRVRTRSWLLSGAAGAAPELTKEQRAALDSARGGLAEAEARWNEVESVVRDLQRNREPLEAGVREADRQIQQLALAIVVKEAQPLLAELQSEREAVRTLELRLRGLTGLLVSAGAGASTECAELGRLLVPRIAPISNSTIDEASSEWRALFDRLIAQDPE